MNKWKLTGVFTSLAFAGILAGCPQADHGESRKDIIIWHWMTDREDAFLALAEKYKNQTGVEINFQLFAPSDAYAQKVRVGAQTNSLPDIFGILGESRDLASFISAGHIENLSSVLGSGPNSWKSRFFDEALVTTYFGDVNQFDVPTGYYGVPIDVTTIPMIYNKDLFKRADLDPENPPETWGEFLEAGKKLREIGVSGFVSGWGETWLIYSLFTDLAHNLMGAEKVMDTFAGNVPYTDADWKKVFAVFESMQKGGFADPSLVTLENKNAEKRFASGRAGMTFNGSWAVNVYAEMNPNLAYAPFRPPALNPDNPRPVWGGAGSVFFVNAKSKNKDKAIEFLKWFTAPAQAEYLLNQTKNLPAVNDIGSDVSAALKGFSLVMKDSIHPNRFSVSEDPRVVETINKGIQSILIAERTPAQVAADVQKMKDQIMREKTG